MSTYGVLREAGPGLPLRLLNIKERAETRSSAKCRWANGLAGTTPGPREGSGVRLWDGRVPRACSADQRDRGL
jgi:hypothetical protein